VFPLPRPADAIVRVGRCKRADGQTFVLDLIDRHGQLLLGRRVYAAADAAGIDRWVLKDVRERWGIETRKFHDTDGRTGCVSV